VRHDAIKYGSEALRPVWTRTVKQFATLDFALNVAVIVSCAAVGASALSRRSTVEIAPVFAAGKVAPQLKGVRFNASDHTLILVVRSTCLYCTESMPLYRALSQRAQAAPSQLQLVVLSSETRDVTSQYLRAHDVSINTIADGSPRDIGVSATPTLLAVSRDGIVERAWTGVLDASEQADLRGVLNVPDLQVSAASR